MFKAQIVADSLSPQGHRLGSVLCTFPRIILAEVNTHRMLGKNTSSSRAIPFKKMVEAVKTNPFIPIAWQKDHPGMQGTEYLDPNEKCSLAVFSVVLSDTLNTYDKDSPDYVKLRNDIRERIELIETILSEYKYQVKSLNEWWLFARDKCVEVATILYVFKVTKQLCNRLLEPFMWTTMLITGNFEDGGWDNFFTLRCPQYQWNAPIREYYGSTDVIFKSKIEYIHHNELIASQTGGDNSFDQPDTKDTLGWLKLNKGQAEIHMMALAECIYDAFMRSTPKQLKVGEWHIPFGDQIDLQQLTYQSSVPQDFYKTELEVDYSDNSFYKTWLLDNVIKVSTAMGARTSYTIVGDEKEVSYSKLIELDDRLLNQTPPHSSPMEHCSRAMSNDEYKHNVKGKSQGFTNGYEEPFLEMEDSAKGWCRNYRGFIQRRHLIENGERKKDN